MATVITIANQKGGVGKTTTTRHLAYFLERRGQRVLVIDNDHQGNITQYFGLDPVALDASHGSMFHVYSEGRPVSQVMVKASHLIHVAPATLSLAEAGARLVEQVDVNGKLRTALAPLQDQFDIILIDSGPNLERLLINALVASQWVLVPAKTDALSISGIPALMKTINQVRPVNPALRLLGVLPTIYHQGRTADEKALKTLREAGENDGVPIFSPIPAATNYDKAADAQKPVFELFPDTPGFREYEQLAEVVISL